MPLILTSPPAVEPVSLAEAKAHLRLDGAAEDVLIGSLILTSRLHIEAALGLALITQGWTLVLDRWPDRDSLSLPLRPVQSIAAVRVLAADGTPALLDPGSYLADTAATPPRLVRTGPPWPDPERAAGGIEIAFAAGFGPVPASVPEPLRQALLLLVAHWYEHRTPAEAGLAATAVPAALSELLLPYRLKRL